MRSKKYYVTQPSLPPLEGVIRDLREIWGTRVLTNNGPYHVELEKKLCEFLRVPYLSLFNNATIALITALQALRITGEVITTPYSFVATAHSLLWNGLKPVFVDIDPVTLNIDALKIAGAITRETTAIMPVHCYGHPCDVDEIQRIADEYNLKVIYDAAHAFAIDFTDRDSIGESVLSYGDLSILSFHATKVFNTLEGGAIISPDIKTKKRIDQLKNFGFVNETTVVAAGINGKMSEFNAVIGLHQLKYINSAIEKRKKISNKYDEFFKKNESIRIRNVESYYSYNYSYYPVWIINGGLSRRDRIYNYLKENDILARRYFYPLISDFPMYRNMPSSDPTNLLYAKHASDTVLCLPLYEEMTYEDVDQIVNIFLKALSI